MGSISGPTLLPENFRTQLGLASGSLSAFSSAGLPPPAPPAGFGCLRCCLSTSCPVPFLALFKAEVDTNETASAFALALAGHSLFSGSPPAWDSCCRALLCKMSSSRLNLALSVNPQSFRVVHNWDTGRYRDTVTPFP